MALNSADFYPLGPIRSADIQQFVNLFTGVMTDQPITFANTLSVGGHQGAANAPLKVFGAVGQTSDLIDLYPTASSANPTFGLAATGSFAWGAGGTAVQDTFMSRIGTQNGHVTDTAGLFVQPNLEIGGALTIDGSLVFHSGGTVSSWGTGSVEVAQNLMVPGVIYVGADTTQYLQEVRGGSMGVNQTLLVHGADAVGAGLTYAQAHLQVRSDDLPDTTSTSVPVISGQTWAGNWLQFSIHMVDENAGQGWQQKAMIIGYDVDNTAGGGGFITMMNQRVGICVTPVWNGDTLQVGGNTTITGTINAAGSVTGAEFHATNGNLYIGSGHFYDTGGGGLATGAGITINGNTTIQASATVATNLTIQNGNLFIGPQNRRIYYNSGDQSLHVDWDWRVDSAHDVYTHNIHLVANSGDCNIGSASGQMDYYGPNGSTNHRFFHLDTSWMGCQAANFSVQSSVDHAHQYGMLVADIDNAVVKVNAIDPVYYYHLATKEDGSVLDGRTGWHQYGFAASQVAKVLPEIADADTGMVDFNHMLPVLWAAVREIDTRLQAKGI